jgi:uncharacterized protein
MTLQIDWNHFTPWASLAGGLLIGAAAALLVLGVGRIAGIAGIVANALQSLRGGIADAAIAWWFLLGLALAPWGWRMLAPLPSMTVDVGPFGLIAAGLLVGYGVRLGNGCTSGHGVCGLGRLSRRSLANVLTFTAAGALTVFMLRHVMRAA